MNLLNRLILSALALVVFATSSVFAFDTHMCEGKIESRAFFSQAQACEKMAEMNKEDLPECCKKIRDAKIERSSSKFLFKKKPCCYNDSFEFKSDQNQDTHSTSAVITTVDVIEPISFEYLIELSEFKAELDQPFRGPPTPEIRRNLQSLYQVYII